MLDMSRRLPFLLLPCGLAVLLGTPLEAKQSYLKASNTDPNDSFGKAVALEGSTLVVGAPRALGGGALYVFEQAGESWVQQAILVPPDNDFDDRFGASVALEGDTLVAGAPLEDSSAVGVNGDATDDAAENSGAVYVYRRINGAWTFASYLKPSDTGAGDRFGTTVDLSLATIVVGAPFEDGSAPGVNGPTDDLAPEAGAAYVFQPLVSSWTETARLKPVWTGEGDRFGESVAISGARVIVGAPLEDSSAAGPNGDFTDDSANSAGAAYSFVLSNGAWLQEAYLKPANTGGGDRFGTSVAIRGDLIAVGAEREASGTNVIDGDPSDDSAPAAGAAYLFRRSSSSFVQEAYLKASNPDAGDQFGRYVRIDGETVVVGAEEEGSGATGINGDESDNSAYRSGAAYVFQSCGGSWSRAAYVKAPNTDGLDTFGCSLAVSAGRLAIGASGEDSCAIGAGGDPSDNSCFGSGAAYVYELEAVGPADQLCLGDGSAPAGCGFCPCGNFAPVCSGGGCLNSSGNPGRLIQRGPGSIQAASLRFEADGLPPLSAAVLTSGASLAPTNPQNPCVGTGSGVQSIELDGLRCVAGDVRRHGARFSDARGEVGTLVPGWGGPDAFLGLSAFQAGETRHFQIVYRDDVAAMCTTGSNSTQAISVNLLP